MELKDFITATLVEINQGVQASIEQLKEQDISCAINPAWVGDKGTIDSHHVDSHLQKVDFDIAVTTENSNSNTEKGAIKGGIKVIAGSIDKTNTDKDLDSKTSRIKFSVPFIPPITAVNIAKIKVPKMG